MSPRLKRLLSQGLEVWNLMRLIFGWIRTELASVAAQATVEFQIKPSQATPTPPPDFQIEPWDTIRFAIDEPLVAPSFARFQIRSPDEITRFLIRVVRYQEGSREIWIKREGKAPALRLFDLDPDSDAHAVLEHFQKRGWSRWIYLDDNFDICINEESIAHKVLVVAGTDTYWRKEGRDSYEFKLQGVPEDFRWGEYVSTPEIVSLIKEQLQDVDSSCYFAFRWSNMTDQERNVWLYRTEKESFDQCERILKLFMWSSNWWEKEEEMVCVMDELPWSKNPDKTSPNPLQNSEVRSWDDENGWIQTSITQRRLLAVIDRHFGVYYDEKCRVHQQYGRERQHCWYLRVKPPTFHERLEARLELRDWLQDKVAPEEIPFLLGEAE
ncbi:hypothetical protein IAD21_02262 [Abditibacteriota bacterium]|nr:hypothetical protein IAD21_02262 [Abditibacteriota bacterium]